jgi:hypothetical protein
MDAEKTFGLIVALTVSCSVQAQDFSFKNLSANRLDWTKRAEKNTGQGPFGQKKDFNYAGVEGGLGGSWGELYGFLDIENPTSSTRESGVGESRRLAWKAVGRVNVAKVGDMPVQLYAHVYDFSEHDFNDQNRVVGVGTAYSQGAFWLKPFVGVHVERKTGVCTHVNGGMAGWALGHGFKLGGQSMMITSWHETEFGRKDRYLVMARDGRVVTGKRTAQNGAVSLWWNATPALAVGTSYRYASHKLGSASYMDGFILTGKYGF